VSLAAASRALSADARLLTISDFLAEVVHQGMSRCISPTGRCRGSVVVAGRSAWTVTRAGIDPRAGAGEDMRRFTKRSGRRAPFPIDRTGPCGRGGAVPETST
jgi:hypothetical protein